MTETMLRQTDWQELPQTEAELRYLPPHMPNEVDGNAILENLFRPASSGLANHRVRVPLHDVASLRNELSLDREGFVFAPLDTGLTGAMDKDRMEAIWVPAAHRLLKELTGARAIASWEFTVRYSERSTDPRQTPLSAPASAVHGDFGPAQFARSIDHHDANAALRSSFGERKPRRWRCFNVWQPISAPPYDSMLAVCDARTVSPEDVVLGMAVAEKPEVSFPVQLVGLKHSPRHRWAYCSDMTAQDVLVFSGFDPACPPPYRMVPHSAFLNPHCPPGSEPRNSVELRAVAVFD